MEPFNLYKFFSGFNLSNGGVLGKVMYYGLIALLVAGTLLGIYHKLFIAKSTSVHVASGATYVASPEPAKDLMQAGCSIGRAYLRAGYEGSR